MLAKGDSVGYMVLEGVYDIVLVGLIVFGYSHWGLFGTGVALSASYLFDIIIVSVYACLRYQYKVSMPVVCYAAVQFSLGLAAYLVTLTDNALVYWPVGTFICLVSLLVSIYILHQKTRLWASLTGRLRKRFHKDA